MSLTEPTAEEALALFQSIEKDFPEGLGDDKWYSSYVHAPLRLILTGTGTYSPSPPYQPAATQISLPTSTSTSYPSPSFKPQSPDKPWSAGFARLWSNSSPSSVFPSRWRQSSPLLASNVPKTVTIPSLAKIGLLVLQT